MPPNKIAARIPPKPDHSRKDEWWDKVEEAAASSIKRGLKEARAGKTATHESVMKKYAGWLSK